MFDMFSVFSGRVQYVVMFSDNKLVAFFLV